MKAITGPFDTYREDGLPQIDKQFGLSNIFNFGIGSVEIVKLAIVVSPRAIVCNQRWWRLLNHLSHIPLHEHILHLLLRSEGTCSTNKSSTEKAQWTTVSGLIELPFGKKLWLLKIHRGK